MPFLCFIEQKLRKSIGGFCMFWRLLEWEFKEICPFFEYFLLMDDEPLMIYIIVIQCLRQTSVAALQLLQLFFGRSNPQKYYYIYIYININFSFDFFTYWILDCNNCNATLQCVLSFIAK